jgi:hypothetical protein
MLAAGTLLYRRISNAHAVRLHVSAVSLSTALYVCMPPAPTPLKPPPPAAQGGERAFAFSSGMAALAAVTRLLSAGDHVVAGDDLYGGTSRLLSRVVPNAGVEVSNVDTSDLE